MALCSKGAERELHSLDVEESQSGTDTYFPTYNHPLTNVDFFKYLGHILKDTDDDWPVVLANLRKARKKWGWMSRIIGSEVE